MKKPRNDCGRPREKADQQQQSHAKQTGPGNGKHGVLADVSVTAKSNKPTEFGNEWTVEGCNGLSKFAADKAPVGAGEQIVPVTSQEQRINGYLQPQADTQSAKPLVRF